MLPSEYTALNMSTRTVIDRTEETVKVRRSSLASMVVLALTVALVPVATPAVAAPEGRSEAPAGQVTFAVHVSLAPTWFDPAETPGVITPFMMLYALHDALVKPMPGNAWAPSLAESWTASKDGLTTEFVLRKGVKFHNGDTLGAEDVKFSFERYKGAGASTLKARVSAVEVVDAHRVRFRFKQPWPDFMTFYATPATGAAWIVPKGYTERVGEEGFKKAPVGAGPYRFVSFNPGIELVVEAYEGYWRKTPAVKRLVFKSVPDESTRLAMVKRSETDVAYSIRGPNAEEVKRTPGLTLKATLPTFTEWIVFTEQWDPKSPWADRRVRLAANLAIDRKTINEAEYLGHGKTTSSIIPRDFEFFWAPPAYPYDPARAKQLLAEAGYPKGFDAVEIASDAVYAPEAEAVINGFQTIGIRARLRPMERAGFYKADQEKTFKHLVRVGSAAAGNAATRIEAFAISGGIRAYGGYPDLDALFRDQAAEMDKKRREAMLHKIQQLMYERAMFAPIVEPAFLTGVGPRLAELPTITGHPYLSPYEDLKLKGR
jgi:peptide/nickel transport system substrate-binding protein